MENKTAQSVRLDDVKPIVARYFSLKSDGLLKVETVSSTYNRW